MAPPAAALKYTPLSAIPGIATGARAAFASGVSRPVSWRREQLRALVRMVRENEAQICESLYADLRRPPFEGVLADTAAVLSEAQHALAHLDEWVADERVSTPVALLPGSSVVHKDPLGCVLIIAPWNFAYLLCFSPLISALAAGNTAVIKPSELAPACAMLIESLCARYLDPRAVRIVQGGVEETTLLLAQRFDGIFYTGNSQVGKVVMAAASKNLTPCVLELGGKSPAIVDATANLDRAAASIIAGKCLNAGQVCIAPDYVLVERSVESALTQRLIAACERMHGADPQRSADFGRIVNRRHFDRLSGLLKGAGGTVVHGGKTDAADLYIAPTLLRGPFTPGASILKDEIFGPLLPIIGVDSIDDAVRYVNEGDKPLALYVFSSSSATQRRLIAEVPSGGVTVNDTISHIANPHMPFGGVGNSGMGGAHGIDGFNGFTHRRAVYYAAPTALDFGWLRFPPYTPTKGQLVKTFFSFGTLPLPSFKNVLIAGLSAAVVVLSLKVAGKF